MKWPARPCTVPGCCVKLSRMSSCLFNFVIIHSWGIIPNASKNRAIVQLTSGYSELFKDGCEVRDEETHGHEQHDGARVAVLVVRPLVLSVDCKEQRENDAQGKHLDELVQPITGSVDGQVSIVLQRGVQAADVAKCEELERSRRHALDAVLLSDLKPQQREAEDLHSRTQRQERGECKVGAKLKEDSDNAEGYEVRQDFVEILLDGAASGTHDEKLHDVHLRHVCCAGSPVNQRTET